MTGQTANPAKQAAARLAAERLQQLLETLPEGEQPRIGVGTGSTTRLALEALAGSGEGLRLLRGARLYASSLDTLLALRRLGLEAQLSLPPQGLHLYFDGADEVSFEANTCLIIKGRGAAMTREKILAYNSRYTMIVVDESKLSSSLGEKGKPLPVEVHPDALEPVLAALRALGVRAEPRLGCGCRDGPAVTDNCGVVIDTWPWGRYELLRFEAVLDSIPGVIGHGAFAGYVDEVVVGRSGGDGWVRACRRTRRNPGLHPLRG